MYRLPGLAVIQQLYVLHQTSKEAMKKPFEKLSPVACTPPACSVGEYISITEIGSAFGG